MSTALPTTIDGVISELEAIVEQSKAQNSRMGYFPALYKRVTITIKNKIAEGYFDDNPRMEELDVVFANRYLAAVRSWETDGALTESWKVAFTATRSYPPIVMQHLFLGMNAHISLDLGIAAATVCPGDSIQGLKGDFDKINAVLGSLVGEVQSQLARIWWPLKPIDWLAGNLDESVANFAMEYARDKAWEVALAYAPLATPETQQAYIDTRDGKVAGFAKKLYRPGFPANLITRLVRWGESGSVRKKIEILDRKDPQ